MQQIAPADWLRFKQLAITEFGDGAQAEHWFSQDETDKFMANLPANLGQEEKQLQLQKHLQEQFWNIRTRRQTDADTTRDRLRVEEWRYLSALERAVGNAMPATFAARLMAAREFKNPSEKYDPGRLFAIRIRDRVKAYPADVFGNEITVGNQRIRVRSNDEIKQWEQKNYKIWQTDSYPPIRALLPPAVGTDDDYVHQREALVNWPI